MDTATANSFLPTAPVGHRANPLHLIYTIIAEPKWGKTTWMTRIPNSILLAFEQGHSFIEAHKIVITAWKENNSTVDVINDIHHMTFTDFVTIICASDQFEFVIFDTADMAAKMCLDYHMRTMGIKHPSDLDFGKGYDTCLNTPFRQAVGQIVRSGRGVGFITHTDTKDSRFAAGTKSRKECTLPGGLVKFIIPQSDLVLHGKFGAKNKATGKRDRILVTEGSDDMLAGNRVQGQFRLPSQFTVDPVDPWGQWASFFENPQAAEAAEADANRSERENTGEAGAPTGEGTPDSVPAEPAPEPQPEPEPEPVLRKKGK